MYADYKAAWDQLTAPGADFEIATANVRGVDIRTYANAPANLRDVWLSTAAFAERDYLVYENERLTYARNPPASGRFSELADRPGRPAW